MSAARSFVDRVFLTSTTVAKVAVLAEGFHLLELEGEALSKGGQPGDKLQIHTSGLATMRTYTPFAWDVPRGRMQICAFTHGDGSGARWVRALRDGDPCSFFGPRGSLAFAKMKASGPIVLFGDETSLGVGASLRALRGKAAQLVFEATSAPAVSAVVDRLELADTAVLARTSDDAHLREVAARIVEAATKDATIVLTGNAKSIIAIRQHLREAKVDAAIKSKAYWAEGRTGLD
jgi:NADPH-dependent ferric siderophore reductase